MAGFCSVSELDLNDHVAVGGAAEQITLDLNWYANPCTRFMFNYVRVDNDDADGDDPEVLQFRAQIDL